MNYEVMSVRKVVDSESTKPVALCKYSISVGIRFITQM